MYHTFGMRPSKTHKFFFALFKSLFRISLRIHLLFCPKSDLFRMYKRFSTLFLKIDECTTYLANFWLQMARRPPWTSKGTQETRHCFQDASKTHPTHLQDSQEASKTSPRCFQEPSKQVLGALWRGKNSDFASYICQK